ncbi:nuclear transport factor 2 family protein [Saccharothrix yanglingensis]|uniref:Serine/arginine repetitive matrix protein 1 n=1 Tax=Saccharothrix yanglingensis TaxID=659496 RepID=A0ABU0X9U4_9PSEU|nr:nuclear transport factor 2 family protein [Saccharothrix yanglingensis]MDQ2588726.1 serine/arginine repetitive matrix protein 1 [Saccharothrix yanglingensis]
MNAALEFKARVESGDVVGATGLFADDVVLHSPVKFRPFEGIDAVRALFRVLQRTFADFRYVGQYDGPNGHVLHFRTLVEGKQVEGIDLLELDDEGRIGAITVMIRPQSALIAVGEAILAGLVADGVVPAGGPTPS